MDIENKEGPGGNPAGSVIITGIAVYLLAVLAVAVTVLFQIWPHGAPADFAGGAASDTATVVRHSLAPCDSTRSIIVKPGTIPEPDCVVVLGRPVLMWAEARLLLIILLAGALGGLLHSLRSLVWYVGNRKFYKSWIPTYLLQPLIGALISTVFYLVIRGGFFSAESRPSDTSPYGFAAVGALVGMFSVQAILKLKAVFETLLMPAAHGKDAAPQEGTTRSPLQAPATKATPITEIKQPGAAMQEALKKVTAELWRPGVTSIGGGTKISNGIPTPCIRIKVNQKITGELALAELRERGELFPKSVTVKLASGEVVEIPIDVVEDGVPATQSCGMGAPIANAANPGNRGTVTAVVQHQGVPHLLTCYHVVRHDHNWSAFQPGANDDVDWIQPGGHASVGKIVWGKRTSTVDVALVRVATAVQTSNEVPGMGVPSGVRAATWDDVFARTTVHVPGAASGGVKTAAVVGLDETIELRYMDGVHRLNGVVAIATISGHGFSSMTHPGDSGAIVIDGSGKALGLVVGAGKSATYVVPLIDVFTERALSF